MNGFEIRKSRDTKTILNLSENEKEDLKTFFHRWMFEIKNIYGFGREK